MTYCYELFKNNVQSSSFYWHMDHYALCLLYHSNTERTCLQVFVRLSHHDW